MLSDGVLRLGLLIRHSFERDQIRRSGIKSCE